MVTMNEKVDSRSAQEKRELFYDSRRDRETRSESTCFGNQQERTDRENSPRSDFSGNGYGITGKIIRQLINDYANQVAQKREQKKQVEEEIVQLDSKIEELNSLLEQIETKNKT
jgi:hypothetical protein